LKVFDYKICLGLKVSELMRKFIRIQYLLLAAVVSVAVGTVTLPNLLLFRWWTCFLVLFRFLIALALIEDDKFISVYGYTWKLSCPFTIFHHVLVLLLRYNCDW